MAVNLAKKKEAKSVTGASEMIDSLLAVFKSFYFYMGLISVFAGMELNFISQTYLHDYLTRGNTLPLLSDMILDKLPNYDVTVLYDIFSFVPGIIVCVYIIHRKVYGRIPFILVMSGLIEIVRGIFIVLTPLGNPPLFEGSDSLFNGFSKYELGVYPSGHVGSVFLFLLMVKDRNYKWIIFACLLIVIISLFLSHAHYSIDILSGLFFAYAINSLGEKYLKMFDISNNGRAAVVHE
jgi:membrane-associated phospholipid phosphatase